VQISGWPDATDNDLFGHDFQFSSMGSKNTLTILNSQNYTQSISGFEFALDGPLNKLVRRNSLNTGDLCSLTVQIFALFRYAQDDNDLSSMVVVLGK
jgi:hypothetical protein